jgi:hypothetical protein
MDPCLKRHWLDVHGSLTYLAKTEIQKRLPSGLVARNNERLIFGDGQDDPIRQRFVEIIVTSPGREVITVIEFVSPANKIPGDGHAKYKPIRMECIISKINLVEINLTRAGDSDFLAAPGKLPAIDYPCYLATVIRAVMGFRQIEVSRMPLQERLPPIPIPLREGDGDFRLDLQVLVDEAYRVGAYGCALDYRQPCVPQLDPKDAAWAHQMISSAKGHR